MATTKEDYLQQITSIGQEAKTRYAHYEEAQTERDNIIREAITNGVSMYAIAKALGISETAVAKIRDNK